MNTRLNTEDCGNCGFSELDKAYTSDSTQRGLSVFVCAHCGQVQSLPRIDHVDKGKPSLTGGAGWGNIRYGKGFSVQAAWPFIQKHIDFSKACRVLDIGANRGVFARTLLESHPTVSFTGVEPDRSITDSLKTDNRIQLIESRIEDVEFEEGRFDFIYMSHTLEHLKSPLKTLKRCFKWLTDRGRLYLEVPNIKILKAEDIVEEFFIDKHLFHFSENTLLKMICQAGFETSGSVVTDKDISLVLKKIHQFSGRVSDKNEYAHALQLISGYQIRLNLNRITLKYAVSQIRNIRGTKAVWGAGRIFDSLVSFGGLNENDIDVVVDSHLSEMVETVHGCTVKHPDYLLKKQPDHILIMSRAFADEIRGQIKAMKIDAQCIVFHELLSKSRGENHVSEI